MGADAVSILLGTEYHSVDTDRLISGNTCPCGTAQKQLVEELRTERIGQYHTIMSNVAQFSSRLTLCRTLAEYTAVLSEFHYLLHGADALYLCLDTAWNSAQFEGEEYLCCEIDEEKAASPVRCSRLPPALNEERDKPVIFYFSPICFQTRLFGYTVMSYSYPTGYDFSFRDWSKTVADTLEFLRMKNDIYYLKQCQRETSLYDSLTGFYNLREFKQIAEAASENSFIQAVKLSFTADGEFLYGENYRNDIVSAAARAIKQACMGHEICCRANGDIFLILCKGEGSVFFDRLKVMLHNAMCGKYDERQVLISYAEFSGEINEGSVELACADAAKQGEQDMAKLSERKALQHYSTLLDIRSSLMTAPHKALGLSDASRKLCVSKGYFRSVYKQCFGDSYNRDCINARLLKARYLLLTTAMSVYAVAVSCGYDDEKYFTRQFKQNTKHSPVEYRRISC